MSDDQHIVLVYLECLLQSVTSNITTPTLIDDQWHCWWHNHLQKMAVWPKRDD